MTQKPENVPLYRLTEEIKRLDREKATGKLILNFSQGKLSGGAQWVENAPKDKRVMAVD